MYTGQILDDSDAQINPSGLLVDGRGCKITPFILITRVKALHFLLDVERHNDRVARDADLRLAAQAEIVPLP